MRNKTNNTNNGTQQLSQK